MNLNGKHLKVVRESRRELGDGRTLHKARSADNPEIPLADLFGVVVGINGVPQRVVNVEFYGGLGDSGTPNEVMLTVENVYG